MWFLAGSPKEGLQASCSFFLISGAQVVILDHEAVLMVAELPHKSSETYIQRQNFCVVYALFLFSCSEQPNQVLTNRSSSCCTSHSSPPPRNLCSLSSPSVCSPNAYVQPTCRLLFSSRNRLEILQLKSSHLTGKPLDSKPACYSLIQQILIEHLLRARYWSRYCSRGTYNLLRGETKK